ncbi:MAG: coproporphyrinogen III oxidase, partial [Methylibium sp.]
MPPPTLTDMLEPAAPSEELLSRLDAGGPRYTSYPTADRFVEAFGPAQYRQALGQRRSGAPAAGAVGGGTPLSIYVHIPFCESVCYYCACNKVITRQHRRGTEYLEWLGREVALHQDVIGSRQRVSQLHLGGGTPTFLDDAELSQLMALLRGAFDLQP